MKKKILSMLMVIAITIVQFATITTVKAGVTDGNPTNSSTTLVKTETTTEEVAYDTDLDAYIATKKQAAQNSISNDVPYKNEWLDLFVAEDGVYKYPVALQTVFTGATVNGQNLILVGDPNDINSGDVGTVTYNYELRYREVTVTRAANPNEISSVNIKLEAPIVGSKVLPVGWTGTDTENIIDDGTMEPDSKPTATSKTAGVQVDSAYWITGTYTERPEDWELLHFGTFNKDTYYYAAITISAEEGKTLSDDLKIKVNGETPAEVFAVYDGMSTYFIAKIKSKTETQRYTLEDDLGNTISFIEEKGIIFAFGTTDFESITDEELEAAGATREQLNELINNIKNAVKNQGTLIKAYQFQVTDSVNDLHTAKSKFKIRIKITEEMKKYNEFYIIYVDDNFNIEKPIKLTVNGDYLEGELDHLSGYALVGNKTETTNTTISNPPTSDNIMIYISMLGLSIIGFVVIGTMKKRMN